MPSRNPWPYKWTITIEASADLVADGFDVANQIDGKDAGGELSDLGRILDRMHTTHARIRIVKAPDPKRVRREQGYTDE